MRIQQVDRDPVGFVFRKDERKTAGVQMLVQHVERELYDPQAGKGSSKRKLYIIVSRKMLAQDIGSDAVFREIEFKKPAVF